MRFSIITPSFNQGEFLKQTIESVISQKGDFEIEYFVMDGGSDDNSINILRETEKKIKSNKRVKFFWQTGKDGGQADAINEGLLKVTGDVVSYINSDDYYLPNAFDRVVKYFYQRPESLWVVGNCLVSDPKLSWTFFLKHIWPINLFRGALFVFNTINQPAVFLRKELVDKVGKFDKSLKYAFDYDYWLRCINFGLPGRVFSPTSVFRVHSGSKGNTGYTKQFTEDLEVVKRYSNNQIVLALHSLGKKLVESNYRKLK